MVGLPPVGCGIIHSKKCFPFHAPSLGIYICRHFRDFSSDCHQVCLESTAATAKIQDTAQATAREAVVLAAQYRDMLCSLPVGNPAAVATALLLLQVVLLTIRTSSFDWHDSTASQHSEGNPCARDVMRVWCMPSPRLSFAPLFPRPPCAQLTLLSIQQNSRPGCRKVHFFVVVAILCAEIQPLSCSVDT